MIVLLFLLWMGVLGYALFTAPWPLSLLLAVLLALWLGGGE